MAIPKRKGPSPDQVEMLRICLLPEWKAMDAEEHEVFCAEHMLTHAFLRGDRFLPEQGEAIRVFREINGGLFPLKVGRGKTGVSIACAEIAHREKGVRRSLLMMPPSVCPQFELAVRYWRDRIPMSAASFRYLHRLSRSDRERLVRSEAPACFVMPYSLLSQPDAMDLIAAISPQLVVADEAHLLKNYRAARTKRLMHFLEDELPKILGVEPMFVAMDGTFTKKSMMEYHHLAVLALKDRSPLPRTPSMAYFWDQLTQSSATEAPPQLNHVMRPLIEWAQERHPDQEFPTDQIETYRRAYRHRFTTAPGVVASGEEMIDCSLTINNNPATQPNADLAALIAKVLNTYTTPNDDEIDHAIHVHKWTTELSAGFWNKLAWPTVEWLKKFRHVNEADAKDLIVRSKEHHAVLQEYHRSLRRFLKDSPAGMDTPLMVANQIRLRGGDGIDDETVGLYHAAKSMEFQGMLERQKTPIRVDDFKIKKALEWALTKGRGLIWVWHKEMGRWIAEVLREAGLPVVEAPAGENELFLQPETYEKVCVASIAAHYQGKNMQGEIGRGFNEQFVLQWPRDASIAEQMMGRTHRTGQKEDEVIVETIRTTEADHLDFAACLSDSIYVQQSLGTSQKLLFADHNPLPQVFSPEFLRERGLQPQDLTEEQRNMLQERYGKFKM